MSKESGQAVCHYCQQPGAGTRGNDGEVYHDDCLPERAEA